jgi:CsoR family transcriptional regulator, copper-sensing transcriptional repressor
MSTIRDDTHKKDLINRLRRVEGQLRGIQAMIEKGSDCEAITQQLSASRRALDKAFYHVLSCAIQAGSDTPPGGVKSPVDKRLEHAAELLAKFG